RFRHDSHASKDLCTSIATQLIGKTKVVLKEKVSIDHSVPLKQRLEDGSFGLVFRKIPKLYPLNLRDEAEDVNLALVRFGRANSTSGMNEELEKFNLKYADIEDLIAFCVKHREYVCRFRSILALAGVKTSKDGLIFFEVPSVFWENGLSISTHQCFGGPYADLVLLCREKV
ncbi:hypothetical protein ACFL1U_03060, partial [Patescibacteria group bacterium]